MKSKMYLVAGFLIAYSTLAAASTAIGTASARGDIRIDGYAITGNATLFDGTAVETSQASATLRIQNGTEIKLATDSMGTLYRDHMVLLHGSSEVSTSSAFRLDAGGISVVPASGNARGVVSVSGLGNVQVAALSGDLKVTSSSGQVLASVRPGVPLSFALQAGSSGVTYSGTLTTSGGNYYITDSNGVMHQVIEKDADGHITVQDLQHFVGKEVTLAASVDASLSPAGGASNVLVVSNISRVGGAMQAGAGGSLVPLILVGGAAAALLATGIYEASQTPSTASR